MKKLEYGLIVDWFHRHAPVTIQESTRIVGRTTRYYRQTIKKSSFMLLLQPTLVTLARIQPQTPTENLPHQTVSSHEEPINV
ncbi:MAG: hypothetical protein CL390_08805 [Acidiferrobacteraceae bacterium]|nr:hypothetical protein [Acidiferrobacteraceae bacterium]